MAFLYNLTSSFQVPPWLSRIQFSITLIARPLLPTKNMMQIAMPIFTDAAPLKRMTCIKAFNFYINI
jgi:hypothetical protein